MRNFKLVKNALHPDNCDYLTDYLRKHFESGNYVPDVQCTISAPLENDPILEKLLEEFLPKMELETGKKLFPTYAYARYYKKGEVMLCHTDRPSCEISATITLGFDSEVWPIFMADQGSETDQGIIGQNGKISRIKNIQKFLMNVGDAVIYRGCDAPHWREEFKGEWQAQVFLHYVDQDGPNAEWKFDKRKCLSHMDNKDTSNDEIFFWYVDDAISKASCDLMIEKFEQTEGFQKAQIGGVKDGSVDLNVRDVNKLAITNEIGIGATLTGIGFNINQRSWKFDVTRSNQCEYLRYDQNGHYKTHVDSWINPSEKECRKITVLAFLNDDFEGGKFYLQHGSERIYPNQSKGTVIAFPSFMNHGVEPVTSGVRRSIVTWIVGPWFR